MSEQVQILLKKKDSKYSISPTNLSLPLSISWTELNKTLLALLKQSNQIPDNTEFDFLINEQLFTTSLQDFITANAISTEQHIEIEYIDRRPPPSQPHIVPHPDWISSLTLAGNQVLTGSYDGHIRRWNLDTYSLVSEFSCHEEPVTGVMTITNDLVATVSSDESMCIWQGLLSEKPKRRLLRGFHSQPITCLTGNGKSLCTASWDRTLNIWPMDSVLGDTDIDMLQAHTISPACTLEGHSDVIASCVWGRDTSKVVSCSWDHNVIFWDVATQQDIRVMSSSKALLSVSENSHSGLLATGGSDNIIRVWNTGDDEPTVIKLVLKGHTGWVSSVSWSHLSEYHLISGSYDGSMKHWDTRNNKAPMYTVGAHKKKLLCMDWRDGEVVASGGEDSRLIVSRF